MADYEFSIECVILSESSVSACIIKHRLNSLTLIRHPNICPYFSVVSRRGAQIVYLIGECSQENIKSLRQQRKFTLLEIRSILRQVTDGLYFLDSIGIKLSNLHPENIFVSSCGRIRIGGWGPLYIKDMAGAPLLTSELPGAPESFHLNYPRQSPAGVKSWIIGSLGLYLLQGSIVSHIPREASVKRSFHLRMIRMATVAYCLSMHKPASLHKACHLLLEELQVNQEPKHKTQFNINEDDASHLKESINGCLSTISSWLRGDFATVASTANDNSNRELNKKPNQDKYFHPASPQTSNKKTKTVEAPELSVFSPLELSDLPPSVKKRLHSFTDYIPLSLQDALDSIERLMAIEADERLISRQDFDELQLLKAFSTCATNLMTGRAGVTNKHLYDDYNKSESFSGDNASSSTEEHEDGSSDDGEDNDDEVAPSSGWLSFDTSCIDDERLAHLLRQNCITSPSELIHLWLFFGADPASTFDEALVLSAADDEDTVDTSFSSARALSSGAKCVRTTHIFAGGDIPSYLSVEGVACFQPPSLCVSMSNFVKRILTSPEYSHHLKLTWAESVSRRIVRVTGRVLLDHLIELASYVCASEPPPHELSPSEAMVARTFALRRRIAADPRTAVGVVRKKMIVDGQSLPGSLRTLLWQLSLDCHSININVMLEMYTRDLLDCSSSSSSLSPTANHAHARGIKDPNEHFPWLLKSQPSSGSSDLLLDAQADDNWSLHAHVSRILAVVSHRLGYQVEEMRCAAAFALRVFSQPPWPVLGSQPSPLVMGANYSSFTQLRGLHSDGRSQVGALAWNAMPKTLMGFINVHEASASNLLEALAKRLYLPGSDGWSPLPMVSISASLLNFLDPVLASNFVEWGCMTFLLSPLVNSALSCLKIPASEMLLLWDAIILSPPTFLPLLVASLVHACRELLLAQSGSIEGLLRVMTVSVSQICAANLVRFVIRLHDILPVTALVDHASMLKRARPTQGSNPTNDLRSETSMKEQLCIDDSEEAHDDSETQHLSQLVRIFEDSCISEGGFVDASSVVSVNDKPSCSVFNLHSSSSGSNDEDEEELFLADAVASKDARRWWELAPAKSSYASPDSFTLIPSLSAVDLLSLLGFGGGVGVDMETGQVKSCTCPACQLQSNSENLGAYHKAWSKALKCDPHTLIDTNFLGFLRRGPGSNLDVLVIDIRSAFEFSAVHVCMSVSIPYDNLIKNSMEERIAEVQSLIPASLFGSPGSSPATPKTWEAVNGFMKVIVVLGGRRDDGEGFCRLLCDSMQYRHVLLLVGGIDSIIADAPDLLVQHQFL